MHPWYYAEAGQQRGPIPKEDLQSKLGAGTLEPDALVWSEGMTEWTPANSVAGLWVPSPQPALPPQASVSHKAPVSPYAPPAAAPLEEVDWSGFVPDGPQIRPWVRYFARTLDFIIFFLVFGAVAAGIFPELTEMHDTLIWMIFLGFYNLYEPAMLAIFGATPFKALLRVRVRNNDGSKLSYGQGLRRTLSVWFVGQGLGIPIAALITHIHAYNRLTGQGITSWDRSGNFTVSHRPVQWWRWLFVTGVIAGIIALVVVSNEA
jgi:uncharacterized RDD family membrane protein YckC